MSYENPRIELTDTAITATMKLAEGNPGAVRVVAEMFKRSPEIDPDSALGGLGPLLSLDTHSIYGARIWMPYKDVCDEDMVRTLGVLRAVQLGIITEDVLKNAIENRGDGLDVGATLEALSKRLPRFGGVFATA